MILEMLRELTEWLNDGTHGVSAQLALIPRDAGDAAPTVGTIADETTDNLVAQERLPSLPGIAVNSAGVQALDAEVVTTERDGQVTVHIRYGVANDDSKYAVRDTSYILRAALRSVCLFNAASRTRNSIVIYSCTALRMAAMWKPLDDQIITGAIVGTWQCRDTAP